METKKREAEIERKKVEENYEEINRMLKRI